MSPCNILPPWLCSILQCAFCVGFISVFSTTYLFFTCNKANKQRPFIVAIYNKWPLFAYPGDV